MMTIQVPGKVMLSGEYAVLRGGAAVMMPVPRFLHACETELKTENLSPMVTAALNFPIPEISAFEKNLPLINMTIDDYGFFGCAPDGRRTKLGLGLSAAEAVAAIALRLERAGFGWKENQQMVFRYALQVHDKVQRGLGSGADVAACAYGCPLIFSRQRGEPKIEMIPAAKAARAIRMRLLWTGQAADTRRSLATFYAWLENADKNHLSLIDKLIDISHKLARLWLRAEASALFPLLDEFESVLQRIGQAAGLTLELPIHQYYARRAQDLGGRAKPTGAGGGDMILLLGDFPIDAPPEHLIEL